MVYPCWHIQSAAPVLELLEAHHDRLMPSCVSFDREFIGTVVAPSAGNGTRPRLSPDDLPSDTLPACG